MDFASRISVQEWWSAFGFGVLAAGLVGDIIVLVVPEHRRLLEKLLSGFFVIVIIVGCAFEHVAENRISDLVAQEESLAGTQIADANREAATANEKTADLAAKFGGLKSLVGATEKRIAGEVFDFQKHADEDEAAAKATIAELNRDKADLNKARDDAVAALAAFRAEREKIQSQLSDLSARALTIERETDPRKLIDGAEDDLERELRKYPGFTVNIWRAASGTPDTEPLANRLARDFEKSGWKVGGVGICNTASEHGLVITARKGLPKRSIAADALVKQFNGDSIAARRQADFTKEDPDFFDPLGCHLLSSGEDAAPNPDILVFVGSKT